MFIFEYALSQNDQSMKAKGRLPKGFNLHFETTDCLDLENVKWFTLRPYSMYSVYIYTVHVL